MRTTQKAQHCSLETAHFMTPLVPAHLIAAAESTQRAKRVHAHKKRIVTARTDASNTQTFPFPTSFPTSANRLFRVECGWRHLGLLR